MARKRYTAEQIVERLCQVEVETAKGVTNGEAYWARRAWLYAGLLPDACNLTMPSLPMMQSPRI